MARRNRVEQGETVDLYAIFKDAGGDADEDTTGIKVSIYPPGLDPRLGAEPADAWVYEATLSSGGTGPYADDDNVIQLVETGKYLYQFPVHEDATLGGAFDNWVGVIDTIDMDETFSFVIVGPGAIAAPADFYNNNAIYVRLDSTIADTDGNTLGTDYEFYFTTTYEPMYTSIRRIRLDLGNLIADIPDDTINLAIFEASLEADALTFGTTTPSTASVIRFFNFARRQYVTCVAELILLNALQGSITGDEGGRSKRLADLQVSYGGGGEFDDLLDRAIACRIKWEATLTSYGEIGPGTSQKPSMVIKGNRDPDRPEFGREWEPTSTHSGIGSEYPAANVKSKNSILYRRWRANYLPNRWGSRFRRSV